MQFLGGSKVGFRINNVSTNSYDYSYNGNSSATAFQAGATSAPYVYTGISTLNTPFIILYVAKFSASHRTQMWYSYTDSGDRNSSGAGEYLSTDAISTIEVIDTVGGGTLKTGSVFKIYKVVE